MSVNTILLTLILKSLNRRNKKLHISPYHFCNTYVHQNFVSSWASKAYFFFQNSTATQGLCFTIIQYNWTLGCLIAHSILLHAWLPLTSICNSWILFFLHVTTPLMNNWFLVFFFFGHLWLLVSICFRLFCINLQDLPLIWK